MKLWRTNPVGYDSGTDTPELEARHVGYDSGSDTTSEAVAAGARGRRRFGHTGNFQMVQDARGITRAAVHGGKEIYLRPPPPPQLASVDMAGGSSPYLIAGALALGTFLVLRLVLK